MMQDYISHIWSCRLWYIQYDCIICIPVQCVTTCCNPPLWLLIQSFLVKQYIQQLWPNTEPNPLKYWSEILQAAGGWGHLACHWHWRKIQNIFSRNMLCFCMFGTPACCINCAQKGHGLLRITIRRQISFLVKLL